MIQPRWDTLAESTQIKVNGPTSRQLQDAYNAGYYRALNEQVGEINVDKKGGPAIGGPSMSLPGQDPVYAAMIERFRKYILETYGKTLWALQKSGNWDAIFNGDWDDDYNRGGGGGGGSGTW